MGARDSFPGDLEEFVARVRSKTELPLAVGFRISNPDMVQGVANLSDGVVVGSAILHAIEAAGKHARRRRRRLLSAKRLLIYVLG